VEQAPIDVEASSDGTGDPAMSAESEGATSKEQRSWQQGNADRGVPVGSERVTQEQEGATCGQDARATSEEDQATSG